MSSWGGASSGGGDGGGFAAPAWMDALASGDTDQLLPMFQVDTAAMQSQMESLSWANMKESMEAQMPKKIMGMGYQQRFQVFCGLLFLAALFFALAFFVGLPMIAVRPQKFALSFTMGSITFMGSFGILKGPKEHLQSMCQRERLFFTFIYLGSLLMTLVVTFSYGGLSGYVLVMAASAAQLLALIWYLISFIPGGSTGMQFVMAAMLQMLKPVIVMCAKFQAICCAKCMGWCLKARGISTGS